MCIDNDMFYRALLIILGTFIRLKNIVTTFLIHQFKF